MNITSGVSVTTTDVRLLEVVGSYQVLLPLIIPRRQPGCSMAYAPVCVKGLYMSSTSLTLHSFETYRRIHLPLLTTPYSPFLAVGRKRPRHDARRLLKAAVRRSADLPSCWKSVRVTLWVTRDQLRLASQLMGFNKVLEGLMLQSFQLPTSC